ncbi:MAG: chemotaxis protein CheC [Lachnospiraceae bacterium]|nr:chemotaxis protein CheC [Lachnospiraceae bacterium]
MAHMSLNEITEKYLDVLTEIGNIGAGNATSAVANMLGLKVDMSVPHVELLEVERIGSLLGKEEDIIVGIMLGVENDIDGSMMFLMDLASAHRLVGRMMMMDVVDEEKLKSVEFDEMEMSAIQEIGNIIAGSYLNALSSLTNLTLTPTVPYLAIDMAASILSVPAIQFGMVGDKALLIRTEIGGIDMDINGFYILMPENDSYEKILAALGLPI